MTAEEDAKVKAAEEVTEEAQPAGGVQQEDGQKFLRQKRKAAEAERKRAQLKNEVHSVLALRHAFGLPPSLPLLPSRARASPVAVLAHCPCSRQRL